ncbi:MAG: 4Fe-4S binding protein, partial [Dehalococcoidales bacterium]
MKTLLTSKFAVIRDPEKCIQCQVCINQCSFNANYFDAEENEVKSRNENCVDCQRCVIFCPTDAITITNTPLEYRYNRNWTGSIIDDINKQA